MLKAKKVYFQTNSQDKDRLFECNRESAKIWNKCLELAKIHHQENNKWIGKTKLQKETKQQFHLHSQSVQAVCHKYLFARDAARKARIKGLNNRYPYKIKKNYNTKWAKDGFTIFSNGKIELSMGNHDGKREKPIVLHTSNLPAGQIKEIEVCYDNGLYLAVSYEDGIENQEYTKQLSAAIDLGEIHSIAAFSEQGKALIVTGRKIRSYHQYRNKKLAEISRLQSKCTKGSRKWKKYQRAKNFIKSKTARQLEDALHKTTKQFVDWCLEQKISDVYVGDPEGVQRNTRKKNKTTRKTAQKLSNWSFGQIIIYLTYKLACVGTKLHEVNEAYTTQTCPVCKKRKKISSRNYKCKCGYSEHRDIHGARNILSRALYGDIDHIDVTTQMKYLRIA